MFSLNRGQYVIFNPILGFNVVYASPSTETSSHLTHILLDARLRFQQPLEGFYVDLALSGGPRIEAAEGVDVETTGVLGGRVSAGYRWEHIELGATSRTLFNVENVDDHEVWIGGTVSARF